jgi:hypothetical protein
MKSCKNIMFFIVAAMVIFCQVHSADSQDRETTKDKVAVVLDSTLDGYTKEEIDAKLAQIRSVMPVIPNRYSNDEIDDRIAEVKGAIPDISNKYTNDEIDDVIAAVKNSISATPDVYSKEEIKVRIRALNDAITNLEIALLNIRNSIPAEIKWPVKTKKILTDIRIGIPSDIARSRE